MLCLLLQVLQVRVRDIARRDASFDVVDVHVKRHE